MSWESGCVSGVPIASSVTMLACCSWPLLQADNIRQADGCSREAVALVSQHHTGAKVEFGQSKVRNAVLNN